MIRQGGAQNDHPELPTFMQLYHLLSAHKIMRPPKFGNCSDSEELQKDRVAITFDEFKNCFSNVNVSYRQQHIENLKFKIKNLIETDQWECDDVMEIRENSQLSSEMFNLVLYSNTGYICRKMLKKTKCETCRKAGIRIDILFC